MYVVSICPKLNFLRNPVANVRRDPAIGCNLVPNLPPNCFELDAWGGTQDKGSSSLASRMKCVQKPPHVLLIAEIFCS